METRWLRVVAVGALLVAGLGVVACSASGKSTGSGSSTTSGSGSGAALAGSKLKALTTLDQSKLCGVLHGKEPQQILGGPTAAAHYLNTLGLGIVCEWTTPSGGDGLYVGISTALDFDAAKAVDKALKTTEGTIDGHDALFVQRGQFNDYYTVQVALGGPHDVVVEYRAPTAAGASNLAKTVTPRLLALA